jgi:hypothetical protein
VADYQDTLRSLWGWRKILLLPLGLVLFNDALWKNKFAYSLMIFVAIVSLFCILFYLLELNIRGQEPGVLIRNHATQGMIFSVTLFLMGMILLFKKHILPVRSLWFVGFMLVILGVLVYMTPGRSGYLAFMVVTVYLGYLLFRAKLYKMLSVVFLLSSTLLLTSPFHYPIEEVLLQNYTRVGDTVSVVPLSSFSMGFRVNGPGINLGLTNFWGLDNLANNSNSKMLINFGLDLSQDLSLNGYVAPYDSNSSKTQYGLKLNLNLGRDYNTPQLSLGWANYQYNYGLDLLGNSSSLSDNVFTLTFRIGQPNNPFRKPPTTQ